MKHGDQRESEHERDRSAQIFTLAIGEKRNIVNQRLDQVADSRLADPTERETGEGNTELGCRDVGIEVVEEVENAPGAFLSFFLQLLDTRAANGDQREFGCNEEAIGKNKENDRKQRYAGTNGVLQTKTDTKPLDRTLTGKIPTIATR
jgi:hypothetical protein